MKTHTSNYKNKLKYMGKEIDAKITYDLNGTSTDITGEDLNSVNLHYEGNILKSVMKQLDFVSTEPLEKDTEVDFQFGLKVGNSYEYLNYGNFIVYSCEKQEDTDNYKITCYDKMLYAMKDYEDLNITYPITVRNYIKAICTKLGLSFKNEGNTFANCDKEIPNEKYLDSEGNSLGYTFRDVLDELAQATASTICIDENDYLEIRYVEDAINETETVEGTDLQLTDSEEAPLMEYTLKGDTYQYSTTGKQLFDGILELGIINGNTGLNSANTSYIRAKNYIPVESNTNYKISTNSTGGPTVLVYEYDENYNYISPNKGVYFTNYLTTYETTKYIRFRPGWATTDTSIKFMVEKGTTASIWEEYTGGQPSPSPTYPQSIEVVTGRQEIDVVGKNLLQTANWNNAYIGSNGVEHTGLNNALFDGYIAIQPNKQYVFSANSNVRNLAISEYDSSKAFIERKFVQYDVSSLSITSSSNTYYVRVQFNYDNSTTITQTIIDNLELQLESGISRSLYEPYKRQSYEVNLGKQLLDTQYFQQGSISGSTGLDTSNIYNARGSNYIPVTPNTFYTISANTNIYDLRLSEYNSSKGHIQRDSASNKKSLTIVTTANTYYVRWSLNYNNSTQTTQTLIDGLDLQLEKGSQATSYSPYFTPIELNKIGNYQDRIFRNKNYFDYMSEVLPATETLPTYTRVDNGYKFTSTNDDDGEGIKIPITNLEIGKKYNYYANITQNDIDSSSQYSSSYFTLSIFNNDTEVVSNSTETVEELTGNFTATNTTLDLVLFLGNLGTCQIEDIYIGEANEYVPYGEKGNWFIDKEIGKVVLNGSESWGSLSSFGNYYRIKHTISNSMLFIENNADIYSNYFNGNIYVIVNSANITPGMIAQNKNTQDFYFVTSETTKNDFTTWLSTHNTIVYYVLATPTLEKITNNELVGQLNALSKASTYEGITNISSTFPIDLTYVNDYETIDEEYIKNTRADFSEKYGPINSIVLSRSAESDNVYLQDEGSIIENGLTELKIVDNQIMNDNNRADYLPDILERLNGLTYYTNDFESVGITYLELCDKYRIKIRDNKYPCIIFNDEIDVNNGLNEIIYTELPNENKTDYNTASKDDRTRTRAEIIVNKQEGQISTLTRDLSDLSTLESNDKQELLNKFGDYALDSDLTELETSVSTIQTNTYTRTEINKILKGTFYDDNNNQIVSEIVKTTSGTFDENGMLYEKTNAKTSTRINEIGVRVNDAVSNQELLFAGYDEDINQTIVRTDNMTTRNFLVVGQYSRFQDYKTGTGVFDL